MDGLRGFSDEVKDLIYSLELTKIIKIQKYFNDKSLSYQSNIFMKYNCNNMKPEKALNYLLEKVEKQENSTKKISGIKGLARLLKISIKTAQKLKSSGRIDAAIVPKSDRSYSEQSKLLFYEAEILQICFRKRTHFKSFKFREDISPENWKYLEN